MKKLFALALLTLGAVTLLPAQMIRHEVRIPDLKDFLTLKCDFHTHTVFSDGLVWPTVRVDEAYREGLDAVAITDHIEYRPFKKDIPASHNRSSEIAMAYAKGREVIVIRGSEITKGMPPGHFNAIFLSDCDAVDKNNYLEGMEEARKQGAYIFWNHPGWARQAPDTTLWLPQHTEIYEKGYMQGIEIVNGGDYYPEAHQWAIDRNLAVVGNTDIHHPIQAGYDLSKGEHRPMTLVFAKERTAESIHEALLERRTAVYNKDKIYGPEQYLREIFENSIEIMDFKRNEKSVVALVKNNSEIPYLLKKTQHGGDVVYFRELVLKPGAVQSITIKFENGATGGSVHFEVTNLIYAPGKGIKYSFDY